MLQLTDELLLFRMFILYFTQSSVHRPCSVFTLPRFICFIWLLQTMEFYAVIVTDWNEEKFVLYFYCCLSCCQKIWLKVLRKQPWRGKRRQSSILCIMTWHILDQCLFVQQTVCHNEYQFHACYTQASLIAHLFPTVSLKIELDYEVYFCCHILSMKWKDILLKPPLEKT